MGAKRAPAHETHPLNTKAPTNPELMGAKRANRVYQMVTRSSGARYMGPSSAVGKAA